MRLDKYLQVTGLIKRRTLANEACKLGLVLVNGKVAKANQKVKINDIIDVNLAKREVQIKVIRQITGNSLKKSIRHEYFEMKKDIAKKLNDNFLDE